MNRPKILFVDDEPAVLEVLHRMFERKAQVFRATSGADALEILQRENIDLLVTDQRMPEMTGVELVKAARAKGIDVTTILLTAYTHPDEIIAAINEGQVYRFVTKPWDVNDLSITVKNALERVELKKKNERLLDSLNKRVEALNVMYEVSRAVGGQDHGLDGLIDRLLQVVGRVIHHDVSAVLLDTGGGRNASLRIRCHSGIHEQALLQVKESVLSSHRKTAGVLLPEERVLTRITGNNNAEGAAPPAFSSSLSVPLVTRGRVVGTLSVFSSGPAYETEDGELLDLLVNQTADAIDNVRVADAAARQRIEQMVEGMGDGVVLLDEKNEVVVVNPAARRLLLLGDEKSAFTPQALEDKLGFAPWEAVRGWEYGGNKNFKDELKLFGHTVQITVSPVAEEGNTLTGLAVLLRDVTEQRLLEERKDEFVSVVSHELRTPLTSITGALDLVLNHIAGDVNLKQRRFLEMARESTEKLNVLVDDLLDLTKFARGKMRMDFQLVHLDEVVRNALEKYGPAFQEKRVVLTADTPSEPLKVLADPNRVHQVLNNLLTNAVKFTPENGTVRVECSGSPATPGWVTLVVSNSGDPIAADDLERIFDRFEQAQGRRGRAIRGTGLGLSICRSIVEAHGGRIWSEPMTDGARFVVVMPVEPGPSVLSPIETEDGMPLPKAAPAEPRATVLVVEDSPDVAFVVKAMLIARNFKVVRAATGEEALVLARREKPDVITLDVRLPDVDGLKLADIFRHDPETRQAQVLVISGFDERDRAMRAGAVGFLQKPLQADQLISAVEGTLSRRTRRDGRVLVIDDDARIRAICVEVLQNLGFEAAQAGSAAEARASIRESRPDMLLLDVSLPDGDGFTLFEELKAERAASPMSVIFISARTETSAKVRALKLGGDDYLTKPFDALELGARVESVLRRRTEQVIQSPTTMLPGSTAIEKEVARRVRERQPFAFCYLDLDNLKAYNDYYGFAKADGVVRQTADLLREIFTTHAKPGDFLGHVAGDDFVFVTSHESADAVCNRIIEAFDRIIPLYYDRQDRERGYIEAEDRFGERRRFPIMSVSIVAVISDGRGFDQAELSRRAADLKKRAKATPGSVYLRSDREAVIRPSSESA